MKLLLKEVGRHIIKVLIVIIVLVILIVELEKFNAWFFVQGPDVLKNVFDGLSYFSPVFFIFLYVAANIFLVPSYPFVFTSGLIYGLFWGVVLSMVGEAISATINFLIGRRIRKRFFVYKIKNKKIKFLKSYIDKHGFGVILLLRYLGFYFDVVSYTAGMTRIKYKDFISATFIGFVPYILIYVYAGQMLMNLRSSDFVYPMLYLKLALFGTFILGYLMHKALKRGK